MHAGSVYMFKNRIDKSCLDVRVATFIHLKKYMWALDEVMASLSAAM